jgi:2-dehydro-3-deoxyphosphooctonate aldolase (KDO 8-P synthase)
MEGMKIGGKILVGGGKPLLIAGPCTLENEEDAVKIAKYCAGLAEQEGYFYVFKSSYLKDNRMSVDSYTGPGLERGLEMLRRVKSEAGVAILTDVHCRSEIEQVADICDVIQIPAFLCRQTRLIMAAGGTGKVVNLKKGQFMSPEDMGLAVEKASRGGASGIMITERGTAFGYHNLVVDFTTFERMRTFDVPLIFDVTHSLQLPGGEGNRSGGRPQYAEAMARAAAAVGCDGFFIETHPQPLGCKCDAESMLPMDVLPGLIKQLKKIFDLVGEF